MKKLFSICISIFAAILFNYTYAQQNIKTWSETTVKDFSDNQLTNLTITNTSGGEVQLQHSLVKTVNDYNDNSFYRFIAKDSLGNFVRTWMQGGIVFVKKYSPNGQELTGSIRVNDTLTTNDAYPNKVAMLNNGTYIVIWKADYSFWYGQVFKDDSVKSGSSFRINEKSNEHSAAVITNNNDQNFLLFYTQRINTNYRLHVQIRDINGNQIGTSKFLNPDNTDRLEIMPTAINDENSFWVAWDGGNGETSWDIDLYLRRYNYDGSSAGNIILVNDNLEKMQGISDLCVDNNSNLFAVWLDERDAVEPITGGQYNIYGQIFNSNGNRIGSNIKINSFGQRTENREPNIYFDNNEFVVSWLYWDETNRRHLTYINKWKFEPIFSGEMISSIFDAGPYGCNLENISWDLVINLGTELKFQLRTGETLNELNNSQFYGSDAGNLYYTNNSGETINETHNGDRYIQYKAIFNSSNGSSAILNSVSIKYFSLDTIPPLSPQNLTVTPSHSKNILKWQPNNDLDLMSYKLYRRLQNGTYNKDWQLILAKNITSYEDTSARIGIKYFYMVTAMDSGHNESGFSNEVSSTPYGINIYVDASTISGGDGSMNNPFKSIQEGINISYWGDTIRVLPGTYNNSFVMKNGVSIIGASAEECIIGTKINAAADCVIKGLTITKGLECSSTSPVITENIFRGNSQPFTPAIQLRESSSPVLTKNFITECGLGIQAGYECHPILKNNIIYANEMGIQLTYDNFITLINNTIIAKKFSAIQISGSWSEEKPRIENNIFLTIDEYAWVYNNTGLDNPQFIVRYNNFWNSYQSGTQVSETNLFLDPKFVNLDLQDFHLLSTSPCINSGNPDPSFNDIDGTRNDMGAFGGPDPFRAGLSSQLTKSILISSISGFPGDTISVYVSLDNSAGLAKANFTTEFDSNLLNFLNAELTEATHNFSFQQSASNKEISFSMESNNGTTSNSEEILKINFLVSNNAKTDDASQLILKNILLYDTNLKEINIRQVTNGAFIVNFSGESENYFYVDSRSSGIENGSRKNPFNTIMEAINTAEDGDSIFVLGGVYNERIEMKEGIYLLGSGPSVTTIISNDFDSAVVFYNINKAEISGFKIKIEGYNPPHPLVLCSQSSPVIKKNCFESEMFNDYAIACSDNSAPVIENNYIKRMSIVVSSSSPYIKDNVMEGEMDAAVFSDMNSNPTITRNTIFSKFGNSAVRLNGGSAIIRNNLIYCEEGGIGFSIDNTSNTIISNNIIKDISNSEVGIWIENSTNTGVINNSIITHGRGIYEETSAATVLNNIVINNNNFGVQFSPSSTYNYNDIWNNFINYNEIIPGLNDISIDPLFIDPDRDDFRLTSNSPCINSGSPESEYNDIDGSRNDIGAYGGSYADLEWISNSSSLMIDQTTSSPSDTIEVVINGENMKGMAGLDLTVSYDPSLLKIIDAYSGDLARSFSVSRTNLDEGSVNITLDGNKGVNSEAGKLLILNFAVQTNQPANTILRFDSAKVKDEATFEKQVFNLKDGSIQIIPTGIEDVTILPNDYNLYQNFPNPFNPATTIRYELPRESEVQLAVYNILGEKVAELVKSFQKAGRYEVKWNAENFASGIYVYQIKAGDFILSKKLILIK